MQHLEFSRAVRPIYWPLDVIGKVQRCNTDRIVGTSWLLHNSTISVFIHTVNSRTYWGTA